VHVHHLGGVTIGDRVGLEPADLLHGDDTLDEGVQTGVLDLDVGRFGAPVGQGRSPKPGIEQALERRDHVEVGGKDGETGHYLGGGCLVEIDPVLLGDRQQRLHPDHPERPVATQLVGDQ
jgi:hypothetical protein